jgi:DNA-directed RNA polymerase specialized sigma subunit
VSSEKTLEGKLFVQFIALIIISEIQNIMRQKDLFKKYTMQKLLDSLDIIEKFEIENSKPYYSEITKKQREIYEAFSIAPPA